MTTEQMLEVVPPSAASFKRNEGVTTLYDVKEGEIPEDIKRLGGQFILIPIGGGVKLGFSYRWNTGPRALNLWVYGVPVFTCKLDDAQSDLLRRSWHLLTGLSFEEYIRTYP